MLRLLPVVVPDGTRSSFAPDLPTWHVPGGIRTPNLLIRSQLLYPVELQTQSLSFYANKFGEFGRARNRDERF